MTSKTIYMRYYQGVHEPVQYVPVKIKTTNDKYIEVSLVDGEKYSHGGCQYNVLTMVFERSTYIRNYVLGTDNKTEQINITLPYSEFVLLQELSNKTILEAADDVNT